FRGAGFVSEWSACWWGIGVATAMITAFGGGTYYALLMKPSGARSFGWQDPLSVTFALAGYVASCRLPQGCQRETLFEIWIGVECDEAFRLFDCLNCSILVAWGVSKALVDTAEKGSISRLLWVLMATYMYSFGGGVTRDLVGMALGVVPTVGNFSLDVIIPAMLGTLLYYTVLVMRCPPLLQLGVGVPAIFYTFYQVPTILG
ncbi:unnamed protein product, partial [Prorocentrum cordatum]